MPLRRRTLLASAASASLAAAAGCTDGFGTGGGTNDQPEHARWVPESGHGSDLAFYVYLDVTGLEDFEDLEGTLRALSDPSEATAGDGAGPETTDRVIFEPVARLGTLATLAGNLSYMGYGFIGGFLDDIAEATPTRLQSQPGSPDIGSLESVLVTFQGMVLEGSFDLEAVDEAAENFERSGDHQGARVYEESVEESGEAYALAAREDAVVLGMPGAGDASRDGSSSTETAADDGGLRSLVETFLDVEAGEEPRLADRSDDAEWALGRAGHGDVATARWGRRVPQVTPAARDDDAALVPEQSDGEVFSLSVSESAATGEMAEVYPEGETPDREEIESNTGDAADEQDVEVDGTRVSVTATYETDVSGTATDG